MLRGPLRRVVGEIGEVSRRAVGRVARTSDDVLMVGDQSLIPPGYLNQLTAQPGSSSCHHRICPKSHPTIPSQTCAHGTHNSDNTPRSHWSRSTDRTACRTYRP